MYLIKIINLENIAGTWGEHTVHKEFLVENAVKNKNKNIGVNGFIVQIIMKKTDAYVLCNDRHIRNITNIDEFTSNNVRFMNSNYIELFPIIDGICEYGDNFQNGGILKYEKYRGKYYTNNNPPSLGTIDIKGHIFFIPFDKETVESVLKSIKSKKKKEKEIEYNILGINWSLSNNTPANGLPFYPYSKEVINYLLEFKNSNYIIHNVNAKWNGLIKKDYDLILNKNKNKNININKIENLSNDCSVLPYDSNEISEEREKNAKTELTSEFIEA
jgi:hypothetical protein